MTEFWQALMVALDTPASAGLYALLALLLLSATSLLLQRRSGNGGVPAAVNRALMGLMGLRLLQLLAVALALAGIAWAMKATPAVERSVHLFSLILLTWLWLRPIRGPWFAGGLLGAGLLSMAMLWLWASTPEGLAFNYTDLDYLWGLVSVALVLGSLAALVRRRGPAWRPGAASFTLLLLGHVLHLTLAEPEGSQPLLAQAANLLALPLLYWLPLHAAVPAAQPKPEPISLNDTQPQPAPNPAPHPPSWEGCEALSRQLTETLGADASALAILDLESSSVVVQCGYDSETGEDLLPVSIAAANLPRLVSGLQRGRAMRLAGVQRHQDIEVLRSALGLSRANYLLAATVPNGGEYDELVAILLRADRPWLLDDQALLEGSLSGEPGPEPIGQAEPEPAEEKEFEWDRLGFDKMVDEEAPGTEAELYEPAGPASSAMAGQLEAVQFENEQYRQDIEHLLAHVDRLQKQPPAFDSTLARQADLIDELQQENDELRQAAESLSTSQGPVSVPSSLEAEAAKAELRLALEQVAVLQSRLDAAQQALVESAAGEVAADKIPADKAEVITSIAQELRQPLSSILGYTDLLLSESVGILGALQRNFLERVRSSTTRMNSLIDNLIHIAELDSAGFKLEPKPVDLTAVIDDAIRLIQPHLQEKQIILRVDLPNRLPQLSTDRDALQQILFHLLQNADAATPAEGEITLRAFTEQQPELGEFVMLQVSDSGGGISEDDLPRVFSRVYRAKNPIIRGVGDTGVGLTIAETLTEALGGRIWVESEEGVGATFSVLMPLQESQATP